MKKAKRKWRRWLNKLKKLGIGTRAMNLGCSLSDGSLLFFWQWPMSGDLE